jgi:glycosyltransferase involved in cell wall biosynthesis
MKILIVTQAVDRNHPILGFFHEWIKEFSYHTESVTVICLEKGEYLLPGNVKVLSLGKEEKNKSKLKYIFNFYKYIWRERKNYDAVFIHMNPEYAALGGIFWRLFGKKIGLWYTHKGTGWRLRLAVFFSHKIFSASKESFRLETPKLVITGHGIDTKLFSPPVRKAHVTSLLSIGRISPVKDYDTIISAVELLHRTVSAIRMVIVGGPATQEDKEYYISLQEKVKNQNMQSFITFAGPVIHRNVISFLHAARIFIHTSETGSLDKAVLEAMSAGLIVVSSNDAMKNILSEHGLVFKKKDFEDLARVIKHVVDRPQELDSLSQKMRDYVLKNHNLENLIPNIIKLYT